MVKFLSDMNIGIDYCKLHNKWLFLFKIISL